LTEFQTAFRAADLAALLPAPDPNQLFYWRRERAIAQWLKRSAGQWNMQWWFRRVSFATYDSENFAPHVHECGSTVCALGDLAAAAHDGWCATKSYSGYGFVPAWDGRVGIVAAEAYFALSLSDAAYLFGGGRDNARDFYGKPIGEVTAADVAAKLRAAPYVLPKTLQKGDV
jgi:hypothetical protein